MEHSITKAINELERGYTHFNTELFNAKLNEQVLITIQTKGKVQAYGWYAPERWENETGKLNEINLSAETLQSNDPFKTLIHEMVHHLNACSGVQDCSRGGKYHNKAFKRSAESAGLKVEKTQKYGFSYTELGDRAKDALETFKPDMTVFDCLRIEGAENKSKSSKLKKWSCGCTNVWAKVEVMARCQACGNNFIES